jgi:hypothetical protein
MKDGQTFKINFCYCITKHAQILSLKTKINSSDKFTNSARKHTKNEKYQF